MNKIVTKKTFTISGTIKIDDTLQDREKVVMSVFARVGRRTIASSPVGRNGKYILKFERGQRLAPAMMELVVGPPINESRLTRTNTKQIPILSKEWKVEGNNFSIEKDVELGHDLVICLLPREIKICGIVCKNIAIDGSGETRCCPVPYAKVEIYDVDSLLFKLESPYKSQIAKEVVTTPIKRTMDMSKPAFVDNMSSITASSGQEPGFSNEAIYFEHDYGQIEIVRQYEHVPLFSKHLLGEAYTDPCGEFCLTFTWYPGCFHADISPDLLFKVSQTFDSGSGPVTTTIYSEGYSDTRWDVPDYHWVKLDVNKDVFVACNPDCHPLLDRRALFLGVGNQELYNHIEQGDDPSRACGFVYNGSFLKSPFGSSLDIKGAFGSKVEEMGERWYRISYAQVDDCSVKPADVDSSEWTSIKDALTDTKYYWDSGEGMLHYESVALGPHSLSGHPDKEFYQIRNTQDETGHDLYWQNQNIIARWKTAQEINPWLGIIDDGLYLLKIEVFDESGNPASDVIVGDDGGNFAHMFMQINNKKPVVSIKEVYNGGNLINMECGSFEHTIGEQVKFLVDAYQPDNHLRYWQMTYQIGYGSSNGVIDQLSDGTLWGGDPISEDFRGLDNEFVIWGDFDHDLGLTTEPPSTCGTFGISIELSACTKTINGYSFLGSSYGHCKEVHAGLAVHHNQTGG